MKERPPISISFNDSIKIALGINMVYFLVFLIRWFIGGNNFSYWQCDKDSTDYRDCSHRDVSFLKAFAIPLIVIYIPIFLLMISSLEFRKWLAIQEIGVMILLGFLLIWISLMLYSTFVNELPSWMCYGGKQCDPYDKSLEKITVVSAYAYMVFIVIVYLIQKRKNTQ